MTTESPPEITEADPKRIVAIDEWTLCWVCLDKIGNLDKVREWGQLQFVETLKEIPDEYLEAAGYVPASAEDRATTLEADLAEAREQLQRYPFLGLK